MSVNTYRVWLVGLSSMGTGRVDQCGWGWMELISYFLELAIINLTVFFLDDVMVLQIS